MAVRVNMFWGDSEIAMNDMRAKSYDLANCDPMYVLPKNYLCPGAKKSTTGVSRNHTEQAKKLAEQKTVQMDYYNNLCRVSKNQIIWGINYFPFANKVKGRIFWDKKNDTSTFSNGELASCSMIKGIRIFRYLWNGMLQENMKNKEKRIHPFQKPVALYEWTLEKFAEPGWKILDTHGGSGTSIKACINAGFDIDWWEKDKQNFDAAVKSVKYHAAQLDMFREEPEIVIHREQLAVTS